MLSNVYYENVVNIHRFIIRLQYSLKIVPHPKTREVNLGDQSTAKVIIFSYVFLLNICRKFIELLSDYSTKHKNRTPPD
jgi:hypothetical protein